jgi:hypothetical protein
MRYPLLPQQLPTLCNHGQAPDSTWFALVNGALGLIHVIEALAPKYFNTRFLRVFVENVPFLVEKLGIKVLPCVVCFIKGVSTDRYVQCPATVFLVVI